ncbi:hypothetical protein C0991_010369 [Blastosporella zonata]|nr:hypothetical protein C0991_010369 [Blastosporella zonata]
MSAFKERTKMSWMTSGCHGKPYENWALPGPAGEMQEVMVKKVNRLVIDAISMRLVDTLAWAMQANMKFKRISDEHASSGLDTDASVDEAEGYMTKLFKGKVALPYSE